MLERGVVAAIVGINEGGLLSIAVGRFDWDCDGAALVLSVGGTLSVGVGRLDGEELVAELVAVMVGNKEGKELSTTEGSPDGDELVAAMVGNNEGRELCINVGVLVRSKVGVVGPIGGAPDGCWDGSDEEHMPQEPALSLFK
jgi:hypothetical protein